ncbi:hypothetical protein HQO83_00555 [Rhodococcus fascians]|nr:hypothetical protein [Rhodococcus fascians]
MTSTTNTERVHSTTGTTASTLLGAASVVSKGPAGVGLLLAKRGYGLARKRAAQRRAATAKRIADSNLSRTALTVDPKPGNKRRVLVFGVTAAVIGGVVFYLGRRRNEVPPPADVPPSLTDYDDSSS